MNGRRVILILFFALLIAANFVQAGQLTSVIATPGDNTAGAPTIYTVNFTTSATGNGVDVGIPTDGKILIIFPAGFDLTSAELAQSTNLSVLDGGLNATVSGDTIIVVRDGTGTAIAGNVAVGVKVAVVGNHQTAATSYTVQVETRLSDDTQIDSGTSSAFTITHGALATFNFNTIANQTAGTGFAITITAKDDYGNTVETFASSVNLSDLSGSISPTSTTNFASGVWSGTVVINQSYSSDNITATYQNIAGTSNSFDVNPGALDHFVFQTINSPQTAGAAFSVTITAVDAQGNQVTSFTDVVNVSDSTGTISPSVTGNFTAGAWTGNVTITQARQDVGITATYGAIVSSSNLFNVQAAALSEFSISTIANQTAGIPFPIKVSAIDQYGNTVESFNETVDISDLTGTISPTVSGNFSQGIWTGDVTITTTQTANKITVVRTSTGVESGQSNSFNVTPGALDHFSFNAISSPQTAGSAFSITITALDANNNTVTSFTGTASLSDLTGTINPGVTGNFSSGVWTGNVTITQSQTSNRITATSGSKTGTSNNFDVNPAALDNFEISSISSPQTAGTPFSITIRALDVYGNLVDTFTSSVNLFDNTGTISPATTGNFSNGVWTGNATITKSQTDVRITASGSGKQGTSNFFNVVHAPLERFSLAAIGTQTAGEPFTITVTALDFYSNRVTDFTGTVDISDLTGTISPTVSGSFDQGQWSGMVTITQVMSSDRITVTRTGGTQTGSSNLFDVVVGNVDHFQISTISSSQTAGSPFSVTITAQDANNQTVTSFTGTVNLFDLTGTLTPAVTGNFTNGVWTGNITITQSYSGDKISVSGAGKSGESNTFDVQSASLDHFTFATIPSPQTAGTAFSVTIEARDVYENVVTSFSGTASLTDLTGTISPSSTTNFSNGIWTGNVTITKSQTDDQITATSGAISGTSNNFTISPAALDHFEINSVSTQTTNEPFTITVTAKDQFNNIVTDFNGKVTISDLTGTILPGLSESFTSGQWSGTVTISQSYTSDRIHVVRQGGTEEGYSNYFDVVSLNVDHFKISTISNQIAGTQFSITIRAEDVSNNLVTGFSGTVTLSDLSNTISPQTSGNFSGGIWTGNVVITKSYTANKITATDGSHAGVSNSFDVSPAALDHFTFQTISSPQTAGSPFSITIIAKDAYENTVTSQSAPVSLSDNTGTISPVTTGNFSSGSWSGNVTITKSQTDVRITASYSGKQGQSNYFNVDPGALSSFNVSNLGTQEAGVPFFLTVTARDAQANVVSGFNGSVDLSEVTGTLEPQVSSNFVNGIWSGNVLVRKATLNDVITVTRTGGTETGQSNAFDVISSQVDSFVISTISSPQTAGASFTITITAKDADLNTVTSFSGVVNLSDLSGTISPQTTGNFSNGVWTGQVTITKSYNGNTIFANGLGESGVSNSFDVDPSSLGYFEIQTVNSPQTAGTAFPITIIARDFYDNKITSFTNAINLSDNTGTLSPATTGNFSSGSWTGNVTITKAQNDVRITALYNGKQGFSNYFNVKPGALTGFVLDPVSTQQAGKQFLITVTAQDAYANVADQFTGTVDISDNSGTIEPQISTNFISGIWSGNVLIRQANNNDRITVTRTNGTETGQSNAFDVISSQVDTFIISTISSPRTAGEPFSITITARDANLNIVTNFTGVVNLSDLTGTISPQTTGSFVNGVWTGNVTITKYYLADKITVTALGESGQSNTFDVNPNVLDHFEFNSIGSPQIAGTPFSVTITAIDVYGNTILSYSSPANLSDDTGTLSPTTTGNFTNGVWTGNVTITKKQNDVRISATGGGKSGISNYFNIQSGALDHFTIANITDQFAGVPFLLTVTARDAYDNVVDGFLGTVDISDLSGTISPTRSGNFENGVWSGNVVVSQAKNNNQITVVKTNGTENGISNVFDVDAGTVDHFEFSVIATSQTAGVPISVTISAIDASGNLVPTFTSSVSLTDLTGTITPTTTDPFSNGIWSGTVKITKAYSFNRIFASGIGKSGESNLFNVLPGDLDHFNISEISSPQEAGTAFSVTITAKDSMENTITSFFSPVSLIDNTGTISPSATTNFTNGEWTGQITITKKKQNVYVRAVYSGKSGQSNYFNVNAAPASYIKIMDKAGGTGQEIGATSLTIKDKLTLYACGFDAFDNYSHDIFATWNVTGNLDPISPNTGTSVVFQPKTPITSGKIYADSTGLTADSTGTISVGSIAYVKIRTAPDGSGVELANLTLTSDDEIQLFCAGYDAGDNFIGNISVQWRSEGNLTPPISSSGTSITFQPTLAPASGYIIADHASATDDTTGLISVLPGTPVGVISLTASPSVIAADGVSTSNIESNNILDADGNRIAAGTQFTVNTTMGSIISTDVNPGLTGKQIAADDSGKVQFVFQASDTGGTAFVSVSSVDGSATGYTSILMTSLKISRISSPFSTVSQGQKSAQVSMDVENLGPNTISGLTAGLIFTGPGPNFENRSNEFLNIVRTDGVSTIPSLSTRTLTFEVDISPQATPDSVIIDGWISGQIGGVAVTDTFAIIKGKWRVQTPAELKITRVYSLLDTVSQGGRGIAVKMNVANLGEAGANIVLDTLSFWSVNDAVDVTGDYEILPAPTNPTYLPGNSNNIFDFTVNVGSAATLGSVIINGQIQGTDQNSGDQIIDNNADTTHTWYVKSAPLVGIKGFYPSQNSVTKNQTVPWYLTLIVENNGETSVRLENNPISFFLKGADVSSEYQVVTPNKFKNSGTNILTGNSVDTLIYTITKTGSSTGEITIRGFVYMRDLGTGRQIVDEKLTGISVLKSAQLTVSDIVISQNNVTRTQDQDWIVNVALENKGGTDIVIDTLASRSYLKFGAATDFQVKQPTAFKDGDLKLEAGKLDTLTFIVDKTTASPGNYFINAHFSGYLVTSGDSIYADSQDSTLIVVENPAKLRIHSLQNLTVNPPYVNTGQNFWLRVKVENIGQDEIRQAQINLTTDGQSSLFQSTLTFSDIPGFSSKTDTFLVTAANTPVGSENFSVAITQAEAQNTAEPLGVEFSPALDSTESITIQEPADFRIPKIVTSDTVRASQVEAWAIKVVVKNLGEADFVLNEPKADDISFYVEAEQKNDYIVQPPTELAGGDLVLSGGERDTLIYWVTNTGEDAGAGEIHIRLDGRDKNSDQVLAVQKVKLFYVRSTAAVQLVRTQPLCPNYNAQLDRGVVNRGQNFSIRVWVRNLGRKKVKDVKIQLTTTGGSIISETIREIDSIEHNALDSLDFQITADPTTPVVNEVFTSEIISAKEFDTNLPADIDNSGDNTARIAIQDSAKLSIDAATEKDFTVYTINQVFTLHARVDNIGSPPAVVDSTGSMMVKVPDNYRIIVGEDTVSNNNVVAFYPGVTFDWHILTPEVASGPDTIIVSILNVPLDKNLLEPAQVIKAKDTVVVSTEATNIIYSTSVSEPDGAKDGILSTQQNFVVQSNIQFSPNLEQVWATLSLSNVDNNYRFQTPGDSTQQVTSLVPVRWNMIAPELADEHEQLLIVTIQATEVGNPVPLIYKDTIEVRSVLRAELKLSARISYPEGAKDGQVTTGQRYEIKAEVKNNGTAGVYGDGFLFINLGSTGSTFSDTTETVIKPFKIDSAVTWSLRASETHVSESFLQVGYAENGVPKDENTNARAYYHPKEDRVSIAITTVPGGNIDMTAKIQGPAGALDGVISTDQRMTIQAQIHSTGVRDVESELILPGGFSFAPNVSPVQEGESSAQWEIVAPADSISNAELKVVTRGIDVNNDTVFVYSDTARIVVDVVRKGLVEVVADIKSPFEATDRIVSVNQEFVVEGYLINHGQANVDGNYQLEIILPSGYTTTDSLTKTISGLAHAEWTVRAPDHDLAAANIEVRVPLGVGPRDENSGKEMDFWNANRSASIAVTTYEKSVEVSVLPNRAPNTIVTGQTGISMLGLRIFNSAQDEFSNAIILSGLELMITDRYGEPISEPGKVISNILVRDYSDENRVFADISDLPGNPLININFTYQDTIGANDVDSIDVVISVGNSPSGDNFKVIIPADTSIRITEAMTGNTPSITGISGGDKYLVESDFVIIRGNNLKDSFGNYPNPFGSKERPTTTITYYLKQDTRVDIKIYTLIGELVWSRSFTEEDPQGKKGMHDGDVIWDARNDKGKKVLNGIYVIYFKSGYGETATTKAAVVK